MAVRTRCNVKFEAWRLWLEEARCDAMLDASFRSAENSMDGVDWGREPAAGKQAEVPTMRRSRLGLSLGWKYRSNCLFWNPGGTFNSVTPSHSKRDCTPISYHSTIISSTLHYILTKITSTPSMPTFENAQNIDARWATFNNVNHDQVVIGTITNNYDTSNAGAKQCYSLRFCT